MPLHVFSGSMIATIVPNFERRPRVFVTAALYSAMLRVPPRTSPKTFTSPIPVKTAARLHRC